MLEADFITTARAKGLGTAWILAVHALPHVRPVLLEALGSGLRVSVASLPIVAGLLGLLMTKRPAAHAKEAHMVLQWRRVGSIYS